MCGAASPMSDWSWAKRPHAWRCVLPWVRERTPAQGLVIVAAHLPRGECAGERQRILEQAALKAQGRRRHADLAQAVRASGPLLAVCDLVGIDHRLRLRAGKKLEW